MEPPSNGIKYRPLYERLLGEDGPGCHMTFAGIEQLLSAKLPRSAYVYREWWGNDATSEGRHSNAWMTAGWKVESIDQSAKSVTFVRF